MSFTCGVMQGFKVRGDGRWPNVEAWFNEMETRPTYLGIKSGARQSTDLTYFSTLRLPVARFRSSTVYVIKVGCSF